MQKKIILILLFALVVAVFAIQNSSSVIIKIFQWQGEVSLAFVILGSIVLGSLIMAVVTSFIQLKMGKKIKKLKKEKEAQLEVIDQLHEEIEHLSKEVLELKDGEIIVKKSDYDSKKNDIEDIEDKHSK